MSETSHNRRHLARNPWSDRLRGRWTFLHTPEERRGYRPRADIARKEGDDSDLTNPEQRVSYSRHRFGLRRRSRQITRFASDVAIPRTTRSRLLKPGQFSV